MAEIAAYCAQKGVYLAGKYTHYSIITDYDLSPYQRANGSNWFVLVFLVQAKSGLLLINEKGMTTEAAKVEPEESYTNYVHFLPEEITEGKINLLGSEKVLKSCPRTFYFINQIL